MECRLNFLMKKSDIWLKCFLNSLKFQLILLIFLACTLAITHFGKIQTFYSKYRSNKDPFCSKGLYYRPRSLNKDPSGSTDNLKSSCYDKQKYVRHPYTNIKVRIGICHRKSSPITFLQFSLAFKTIQLILLSEKCDIKLPKES